MLLAAARPRSLVLVMGYSESLFLVLSAGTLLAVRRRFGCWYGTYMLTIWRYAI